MKFHLFTLGCHRKIFVLTLIFVLTISCAGCLGQRKPKHLPTATPTSSIPAKQCKPSPSTTPFTTSPTIYPSPSTTPTPNFKASNFTLKGIPYIYHKPKNWNKETIIFVHGLGKSKEVWVRDMEEFEKLGYGTFAFDLPFHGERGNFIGAEQLPELVKEGSDEVVKIADFLRSDGAGKVYLVSRSLGSIVSEVALGKGAKIDKAELLLASANLKYIFTHGNINEKPSWLNNQEILDEIDPLYFLPKYGGGIHFHCGKHDKLLTPEACEFAYNAATSVIEKKLFWHDTGHSMPLNEYFPEAAKYFKAS